MKSLADTRCTTPTGKLRGFRLTLDAAIDFAHTIQIPPAPRRQSHGTETEIAESQPEKPLSPLAAERQIADEVERSIPQAGSPGTT